MGNFVEAPNMRYVAGSTWHDILTYPIFNSIMDYLRVILNEGCVRTPTYFLFGYYLAKKGVVENIEKYSNGKTVVYLGILYSAFWILAVFAPNYQTAFRVISSFFGALFYALCFLYLYYHYKLSFFRGFEAYGRIGLTNYCM